MRKIPSKKKSLVSFSMIILMSSILFYAYEDGITGRTLKSAEPGCTCHSETQSTQVNVTINGPDELAAGQTAAYSIRITGGSLVRGGTNIAASAGNLQPGEGLQKIFGELTHVLPKQPQGNEVVFEFFFTAPSTQNTVTLYANGNSVNYNGTENGDSWNFAENKVITINTVASLEGNIKANSFYLAQNYPNPFNPSTSIQYKVGSKQFVNLKIYDITAKEIGVLVSEEKESGVYEVEFQSSIGSGQLASGIYFYTLKAGNFTVTKKMLLIQ